MDKPFIDRIEIMVCPRCLGTDFLAHPLRCAACETMDTIMVTREKHAAMVSDLEQSLIRFIPRHYKPGE